MRLCRLAPLVLAAGCTAAAPPPDPAPARPPDLLWVVLDTVRADALPIGPHAVVDGVDRRAWAPQVAALADAGVVFTGATAPGCWTWPVHASMFTGTPPWVHGGHHARPAAVAAGAPMATAPDPALPTVAGVLAAAGYRTVSVSANGLLGPGSPLVRGFETVVLHDDDDDAVLAAVGSLLDAPGDDRPLFLFVNLLGSHLPYEAWPAPWMAAHDRALDPATAPDWLGPFLSIEDQRPHLRLNRPLLPGGLSAVQGYSAGQWQPGPAGLALLRDVYQSELLATDRRLNRLLQSWGAGRAGAVLLTSDHGEHFGEQGMLDHGHGVWAATTSVPLVVAAPGRLAPGTVAAPVDTARLAPTALALVGLDPAALPGESLLPLARDPTAAPAAPVVSACWADPAWAAHLGAPFDADQWLVRDGPLALVQAGAAPARLFDMDADPLMQTDLAAARPAAVARLQAALPALPDDAAPTPVSAETLEALEALGYTAGGAPH